MSDGIVFCETDLVICPVVSFKQFIIGNGKRLVTLIGETHEVLDPLTGFETPFLMPPEAITVSEYAVESVKANMASRVFLEVSSTTCSTQLEVIGSRPIREVSCALQGAGLWTKHVVPYDVRDFLLGFISTNDELVTRRILLYYNMMRLPYSSEAMTPDELMAFTWVPELATSEKPWWGQNMENVAQHLLQVGEFENRPIILSGNLLPEATPILMAMQDGITKEFTEFYKQGFLPYKQSYDNGHRYDPSSNWWQNQIVGHLKFAWAKITDYFAVRNFFTDTLQPFNEAIFIAGDAHTKNIIAYLTNAPGLTFIPGPPDSNTGNTCLMLSRPYKVVSINDGSCKSVLKGHLPQSKPPPQHHQKRPIKRLK